MKWTELSITDIKALYDHSTMYAANAEFAKAKNNGLDLSTEKEKQWRKFWKDTQLSCARRLTEIVQKLEN